MDFNHANADWTAARAEKWRNQLAGMEAMLAPLDEPLIRALRLDAAFRIAEVGCGGGSTGIELERQAPAGTLVHGFDISPALIEVARERRHAPGALAFNVADMATAVPPAGPYDRLVSRFGVMFFADPSAAFRNLVRWLTPDGRFAFAVWGPPADNPWMSVVRETVAGIIRIPTPDLCAPGPFRYSDVSKLLQLLDDAGYSDLEVSDWRGLLPMGGAVQAEDAAEFALTSFASFAEMLSQAGDGAFRDAKERLAQRLSTHLEGGVVRIGACVHIVTGGVAVRCASSREVGFADRS